MNQQICQILQVKLSFGVLKLNIKNPVLPIGTCRQCGRSIYWLKVKGKSLQVNLIKGNEYILHSLVCKKVLALERKEQKKKYYNLKKTNDYITKHNS